MEKDITIEMCHFHNIHDMANVMVKIALWLTKAKS